MRRLGRIRLILVSLALLLGASLLLGTVLRTCKPALPVGVSSLSTFSLHGLGAPPLTNGQVLIGRVRLIVQPFSRAKYHHVGVWLENDDVLAVSYTFTPPITNVAEFIIDTTDLPSGPSLLTLQADHPAGWFGNWIQTFRHGWGEPGEELAMRTWTITVSNPPSSDGRSK